MRIAALLLMAVFIPCASAQNAENTLKQCSVQGTVVDAKTGQPLKGAEVSLRTLSPGNRGESTSSVSDSEGHFAFDSLVPGRYQLSASRNGYLSHNRRTGALRADLVSLSPGQHADDIILRLIPSAVISGRVTSEGDEPMAGVMVQAMKYSYHEDRRQLVGFGNASTNDRGEYRIWGLNPGRYYIHASPPPGMAGRTSGQVYFPIFYPGASDPARTQALALGPGDELSGIDFNFVSVHSVRVSGRVSIAGSIPAKDAQVTLAAVSGSMTFTVGQASTNAKGAFEIGGVPPGSYVLVAEQFGNGEPGKVMRGHSSVEVGERNLSDVEVVIGPGVTVTGHVRIEGKENPGLPELSAVLDPQDDLSSLGLAPDVGRVPLLRDGTFTFLYVPEDAYHIKVLPLPDGYYLKPSGEDDVFTVGRNHAPVVELTLSTGAGRITGTVSKDKQPFAGSTVVLVPEAPRRGQARFYRQALSDAGGRFTISSITPGDYKVFCWEEIERGMYLDPDFLRSYEDSGQAVHVEEGASLTLQLELIPADELR